MLKFLRVAHRWVGLVLLLPMLAQAVTGCFLVLTPVWESVRPGPAVSAGPPHAASEIVAAALQPGLVPTRYRPAEPNGPAIVELGLPGQRGSQQQVMVDPASLAVLGTRQTSVVYRWMHSLHENLLLPTMPGRSIVGWFGVGLLLLGLSGLVLWWPTALRPGRWRAAMTIGKGARGARLQRELHGAAGFWASAMLVVMSVSGIGLAFPQTVRAALGLPEGGARGGGARSERAEALDIDAVLARVAAGVPDARIVELRLPNPPGRPVLARLERPGAWEGAPAITAQVDPAGRKLLSVQDPSSQPAVASMLAWLRALHFGDAFGLPWRLLVFVSGLALPLLAVTGTTLWLMRRRNRARVQVQRQTALQGAAE